MIHVSEFHDNEEYSLEVLIKQVEQDIKIALDEYRLRPFRKKPTFICDVRCLELANYITNNKDLYEKFKSYMDTYGYYIDYHSLMGYRIFAKD